jgi:hypothetical protein
MNRRETLEQLEDAYGDTDADRIQASIAISLKRIADALAGKADGSTCSWLQLISERGQ